MRAWIYIIRNVVVNLAGSILQIHNAVIVKWLALFISPLVEFAAEYAPDFSHRLTQTHKGLS
jgi:hypothetical protein